MKRLISIVLLLSMLAGMVNMMGFQALATEADPPTDYTEEAVLTGLPAYILEGNAPTPSVSVREGDCYVTATQWMTRQQQPVTAFEAGQEYLLAITLQSDTHAFDEYFWTYQSEFTTGYQDRTDKISDRQIIVYHCYKVVPATHGFTEYAEISFPDYYPGDPIPALPEVTAQGGTVSELRWEKDANDNPITDTHFQEGTEYRFSLVLTAPEGYPFTPEALPWENIIGGHSGASRNYSDDLTQIYISVDLTPHYDTIGSVSVLGVPWEAEAGPAVVPDVKAEYDFYTVGQVYWTDKDLNPVTTLEAGKAYYLALEINTANSHVFTEHTDVYTDGRPVESLDVKNKNQLIAYIYYSLEPDAGEVIVDMGALAVDLPIAGYTPIVSGNATIQEVKIKNTTTGQYVTDGVFEANANYAISVTLAPKDGYRFEDPNLEVLPNDLSSYDWDFYRLFFTYHFSTCQVISVADISVVPPTIDGQVDAAVVTAPADAPFTIKQYRWLYNHNWEPVEGTFQAGFDYLLELILVPKAGYAFDERVTEICINGEFIPWSLSENSDTALVHKAFTFFVHQVHLEGLPYEIKAGTAKVPTLTEEYGQVTISKTQWVNTSKKKVTSFTSGKVYYLEVTLKAAAGKYFDPQVDPRDFLYDCNIHDWKYNGDTELVLYLRYSLEPVVSKVTITPSVLAVGTDASNITASVSGNVTLTKVEIYDLDTYEPVTGKLQTGKNYSISYTFAPKSGYRLTDATAVTLNTDYAAENHVYDNCIFVTMYFSTCQKISEVQITLEGVEVGKNVVDVQMILPEDAPYTVYSRWYDATNDWDTASGSFQDLHKYEASLYLSPKEGYAFDRQVKLNVNGNTYIRYSDTGTSLSHWEYFSFLHPLEKVEVPALPTSIKKGQTLPTDYTAPADAPYTFHVEWGIMGEDSGITTASKNGSYLIYFQVLAKEGYAFTDETQVFVGGKQTLNYIPGGDTDIAVYGLYNIGLTEIDRVDITLPAPTTGAKPGQATVSSKAKYTLEDMDWGYNHDGELLNILDVTTFEKDAYVFILPTLKAKTGYVFAADVALYVNGVKLDVIRCINVGSVLQSYCLLGQVIDQPTKLDAPKVTVSGNTLTWSDNGAASYEIYRATSKSGSYKLLDTVTVEAAATFSLRTAGLTFVDESATAGKTYYYKVKAISAAGSKYNSGYSAVSSVAYEFAAPTISVSINTATGKTVISWEKVSGAKSYNVYRATEPDGTYTKLGNTKSNTYTDTKAAPGAVYYYKVVTVGSSSAYNSDDSNIYMSYAILAQPVVKASVDKASGKPSLSWSKITGATGYRIYRLLPGEADFTEFATQEALSFIDTTAPLDTLCTYKVQAIAEDDSCNSAYSAQVSATVALGVPTLTGSINKQGQPTFSWQVVEGAVKYEIFRSTKSTSGFVLIKTEENATSFVDQTAAVGKTYYYKVIAKGQVSVSENSDVLKLVPTCAVPTADVTTDTKAGRPKIFWEKVNGAKSYDIYYATSETGTYKKLANTKSLSYTDTKLAIGAIRYYKVRAVGSKAAYNSAFSAPVFGTGFCAQPQVKITLDAATGKPSLSWSKISGASSYRILRIRSGFESDFAVLDTVTGASFLDTTAPADTTCFYMVQAMHTNEALSSAFSPVLEIAAGIARPVFKGSIDPATGNFVLTWNAVEGAKQYEVYRSTKSNKGFVLLETLAEDDLRFENSSAPGKTYYYRVIAVGAQSRSATPTALKLVGKCQQPVADAYTDEKTGKPVITWEKVSGAKKYDVYRATVEGGKFSKVGTTTKTSYTDTKASAGKVYYYKVVAVGSKSAYNSAQSNATAATGCAPARPVISLKNDAKTGKLTVSWKKVTGATYYTVCYVDITEFVLNGTEPTEQELEALMRRVDTTKTSFTLADADPDTIFVVTVVARTANEEICSVPAEGLAGSTACATPKITGLLSDDGKPAAWWNAVEGAEGYLVYRSTKSNKGFDILGITYDDFFIDDSAVKGKTYYYKITAISAFSESAFSNVVKLKSK